MDESNSLELEPEVINQRDSNNATNENLSKKYDVDIYKDSSNKKIYDTDKIKEALYSNNETYELNTVQYLIEPYFKEIQEYPQKIENNVEDVGNNVLMVVIFIQLLVIFYFIVLYVKKRRRKNENLYNKLYKMGT